MNAPTPHLPVGFSSVMTQTGEVAIEHRFHRSFGLAWLGITPVVFVMSLIENGTSALPIGVLLFLIALAIGVPFAVNRTRFVFRRGAFLVERRPIPFPRDIVIDRASLGGFFLDTSPEGVDLVVRRSDGPPITLVRRLHDVDGARTVLKWLEDGARGQK